MWYNYKDKLINIEKFDTISKYDEPDGNWYLIIFSFMHNADRILFDNKEERDAEFEKIKALIGINHE